MNSGAFRVEKVSLRLRGVSAREARERGASVAREIADAIAREGSGMPPGKTQIGGMSVRLGATGNGPTVAEQIGNQWGRGKGGGS